MGELMPERRDDGEWEHRPEVGGDAPPRRPRGRWAWTLVFAGLVPAGVLMVLAGGGRHADPVVKIIGGALLAGAAVIVLWLLSGGEGGGGGGEAGSEAERREDA